MSKDTQNLKGRLIISALASLALSFSILFVSGKIGVLVKAFIYWGWGGAAIQSLLLVSSVFMGSLAFFMFKTRSK